MQAFLIRGLPETALEARHVDLLEPPTNLLCQLCCSLVPELLELSCGHLMCRWCCQSGSGMPRFFECPLDNKELSLDEKGTSFRSRQVRAELSVLMSCRAACLNRSHGCCMQGSLQEVVDHLDECDFDRIECRRCHRHLPRIDLATHIHGQCGSASFLPSMVCLESADLWRLGQSLQDTVAETTGKQLALHMAPLERLLEQIASSSSSCSSNVRAGAAANVGSNAKRQHSPIGSALGVPIEHGGGRTTPSPVISPSGRAHSLAAIDSSMFRINRPNSASSCRRRSDFPLSMTVQSQQSQLDLSNLQIPELQTQLSSIQGILASLAVTLRETQNAVAGLHEKRSFWNIIRFSQIKTNLERCTKDRLGVPIPNEVFRLSHSGHPAILYAQFERHADDGQFWLSMHIAFRADSQVNMNLEWPFRGKIALMVVHPEDRLLSRQHVLDASRSRHQNYYLRPVGNRGREEPRSLGGKIVSLRDLEAEGFVAADDSITLAVVTSERIKTSFSTSARSRQISGCMSGES